MTDKISISFDEDNRIRVLEADKFKLTDNLKNESMDFMKSIN
jgi:intraflagellar transport protein 20